MTLLAALGLFGVSGTMSAQAPLSDAQKRLVMDCTNLSRELLSNDSRDQGGRMLVMLAQTLDPRYVPAQVVMDAVKEGSDLTMPVVRAERGAVVKQLLQQAAMSRDPMESNMYYLVVYKLEPENAEALSALKAAAAADQELDPMKLFAANKREVLTEDVDYAGLFRNPYTTITDERLENGADRLTAHLSTLDDEMIRRIRADEADKTLALAGRQLVSELHALIRKRKDSLDRLERARNYEPKGVNNPKMYEEQKRTGREQKTKNALADWERELAANRRNADSLMKQLVVYEEQLDEKFARLERQNEFATNPVGRTPTPPVSDTSMDEQMPERHEPVAPPPPTTTRLIQTDGDVDQDWNVRRKTGNGATVKLDGMSTPAHLKNQVGSVGLWLNAQAGRTGNIVSKIVGQDNGDGRVILYVQVTELFLAQNADVRFKISKQLQQMWGQRVVTDSKVPNPNLAYLYTVDESGKVIGGSEDGKASRIYIIDPLP